MSCRWRDGQIVADRMFVAISAAGAFCTDDGGKTVSRSTWGCAPVGSLTRTPRSAHTSLHEARSACRPGVRPGHASWTIRAGEPLTRQAPAYRPGCSLARAAPDVAMLMGVMGAQIRE